MWVSPFLFPQPWVSYTPPSRKNERPTLSLSQGAMERKGADETGCPGPVRAAVAGGTTLPKVGKVRAMGDRRKPQATVCGYGLTTDWQWAINHPAWVLENWSWIERARLWASSRAVISMIMWSVVAKKRRKRRSFRRRDTSWKSEGKSGPKPDIWDNGRKSRRKKRNDKHGKNKKQERWLEQVTSLQLGS